MSINFRQHEEQCNTIQSVSLSEQFWRKKRVLDTATERVQTVVMLQTKYFMCNISKGAESYKPIALMGL